MTSALDKWLTQQSGDDDPNDAGTAALVGAGTTMGGAGAWALKHELADKAENEAVRRTRAFADFQAKLQPGDVLFHRRSHKSSEYPVIAKRKLPLTEADIMMGAKGDPYYHSSIYMGRGKLADAYDWDHGIRNDTPLRGDVPENIRAYRPKDGVKGALKYARQAEGADYAGKTSQVVEHGLEHLFGLGAGPSTAEACAQDPQVCTQFVANAFPDIFPKQFMSPADMRYAKELELVARYEPAGERTLRELALTRGAYPLLKNLKYGLGAAALTYGGLKLAHFLAQKDDNDGI